MRTIASPIRLRQYLTEAVREIGGNAASIVDIRRERIRQRENFAWETVSVRLKDGKTLSFFLKDFARPIDARSRLKSPRKAEREVRVYRELLAPAKLGTATLYGSVCNACKGEWWLLLELVGGAPQADSRVRQQAAAGWLARMQAHFLARPVQLQTCAVLLHHDSAFYRSLIERARPAIKRLCPSLAAYLVDAGDWLERLLSALEGQPQTLVHGEFRARHILFDHSRQPPRVCPLDWETAALGSTLFDLAQLTNGMVPSRRDRVLAAYREQARRYRIPVPTPVEPILDAFNLVGVIHQLGKAVRREYSAARIKALIGQAEQLRRRLQ